jgi:hypothetical protein
MNLNDSPAKPMADIFNTKSSPWSFTAAPAQIFCRASLQPKPLLCEEVAEGTDRSEVHTRRGILGEDHEWNGLHGRRPLRFRDLQPHPLDRPHGRHASLSSQAFRIGLAPESRGGPRALPAILEAKGGAGSPGGCPKTTVWAGMNPAPTNTTLVLGVGARSIPARPSAKKQTPRFRTSS